LRTDPYEFADVTSNVYYDWFLRHGYLILVAQAAMARFVATFEEFPAVQRPNTFTVDDALRKLSESAGAD
jgi:arylsulfatase